MKLALVLLGSLLLFLFLSVDDAAEARASPRRSQEDALADGDIDPEDLASGSRALPLSSATVGRPVLGAPSGSTYLSLVGFSRQTLDERQEIGGFVVLGFPFDRVGRGTTRVTMPVASPSLSHSLSIERTAATTEGSPLDVSLTPRLARSCVTAAWRASNLPIDDERLDAIVSRAHWSAVLPEARLRAVRFEDSRLSLDTGTDTSRLRDSAGANVGLEARLTWRFDRLIYADDEPAFERIRLELRDARTRVASKVLDVLFHWQRSLLDLKTLPPAQVGTRDEADVVLRIMEAEASLDVLTNGWFSTHKKTFARAVSTTRSTTTGGDL